MGKYKRVNWCKKYRKAENKYDVIQEFVTYHMRHLVRVAEDNRALLPNFLKTIDIEANKIASLNVDLIDGYKLGKNWIRMMIAQVTALGEVQDEVPKYKGTYGSFGRRSFRDVQRELYNSLGWGDLSESLNPQYDQLRTEETLTYLDDIGQLTPFKVLLEPAGQFPIGSIWENSKGKQYSCEGYENGLLVMIEEEPNKNGVYRTYYFGESVVSNWKRVS